MEELHLFSIHLAIMLKCGIALNDALSALSSCSVSPTGAAAALLAKDIEKGLKFSEALRRQPENFPETYVRIIQAAEGSGTLDISLNRLAQSLEKQIETRRALRGALIYPCFLISGCMSLILVMLYFIFPMVISVTKDSGVEPPALTLLMMKLTTPKVGLGLFLLGLLVFTLVTALVKGSKTGPRIQNWLEQSTPPGKFFVSVQIVESLRQLSLLMQNGVDLLRSLKYTHEVAKGSLSLDLAYEDVVKRVRVGEELSDALAEHPVFPTTLTSLLTVSAETGQTPEMLDYFCGMLEEELNTQLKTVTTAMEPLIMGVLGLVVGTLLIAAFLPIYNLVQV